MIKILITLLFTISTLLSAQFHFDKYEKNSGKGHTLLVIGGIHGDEPGGYFAPAILEQHYKISNGNLWIVPNLNVDSIIKNRRGVYGDMNRKFSYVKKSDKDYQIIQDIKSIIKDKQVDLLLNLHDGRGFYRTNWKSSIFNPRAWGQAFIIDQKVLDINSKFKDLDSIGSRVSQNLNKKDMEKDYHDFRVKNTKTKDKDEQMQLSLTYFAINNNKPAFAIETSKNLTKLERKVQYQLRAIEEFMKIMDIKYTRDFDLDNYDEVSKIVNQFGTIKINDNISLPLNGLYKTLRYFPMQKNNNIAKFTHPLGVLKKINNKQYNVYIGNKLITKLVPQYFQMDKTLSNFTITVDNKKDFIKIGSIIKVKNEFKINLPKQYRVNVIGFSKSGVKNESNINIHKKDFIKRYSIDKHNNKYRVEIYKNKKFVGMVIIDFG
jgi:hypothetical protein